jgi:uncharacterized protein
MELYTIPVRGAQGKFILYRPLLGLAFVGNRAMADLARALAADEVPPRYDQAALDFLDQIGFYEPDPLPPPSSTTDFCPTTAVLLLTNQCQLRCTYCYASAGESARQELSVELGNAAIDRACENAQKLGSPSFSVSFHGGGEPTLAWDTLQACTLHARQKPLPAHISLTSNGIWAAAHRDWILDHLDNLSLSMDGSPQTQDTRRPFASGKGSSIRVMETIAALDQRKFDYGIRMTAVAPWENLPRDVQFICEQTGCTAMQVEPAYNLQRGGHGPATETESLAFADAFLEAAEIARRAGRRLIYSGAHLGQVTSTFCTAPFDALVVNAAGELVACYEVTSDAHPLISISILGRVADGQIQVDESARSRLHAQMAERRAGCRDCFCYWSCAGDCYVRSFVPGANGHLQYGVRCEQNRYLLEKTLLNALADGDGLWRATSQRGCVAPDFQENIR